MSHRHPTHAINRIKENRPQSRILHIAPSGLVHLSEQPRDARVGAEANARAAAIVDVPVGQLQRTRHGGKAPVLRDQRA